MFTFSCMIRFLGPLRRHLLDENLYEHISAMGSVNRKVFPFLAFSSFLMKAEGDIYELL